MHLGACLYIRQLEATSVSRIMYRTTLCPALPAQQYSAVFGISRDFDDDLGCLLHLHSALSTL